MSYFLSSLPKTILNCFKKYNFLWQIIAIVLTYFFVTTNFDWYYFLATRSKIFLYFSIPAVTLGGLLPIIVPIYIILHGHFAKNIKMKISGWAIGQATVIGAIISSFYKAFTGRIQPNLLDITTNISHGFQFGFLKHGIFWGWPSSHTTIAFAMAFTIIYLFPKNKTARILAFIYALYIGIGVSLSIHWFSEAVAGAIFGIIIGIAVASNYKKFLEEIEK